MVIKQTIVFQQIWAAIHLQTYLAEQIGETEYKLFTKDLNGDRVYSLTVTINPSDYRYDENGGYLCDIKKLQQYPTLLYRRYKYIRLPGSSRSSKTFSCIDVFDLYGRANKNKRLTVWRDTKTDCKKTVLNDVLKHLKQSNRYKLGQEFNKTESIFTYNNGSTFEIHGTDDEETVHGLTQDAAWLNEPYNISREVFDQIDQRTSDFMLIDLNPKKGHWSDDLEKDPRCITIHSTFKDNPFCPEEQRIKILSYQPVKMCALVESGAMDEQGANSYDVIGNTNNYGKVQIAELVRCRENEYKNSASVFNWQVYGLGLKSERPNRILHYIEIPDAEYHALQLTKYYGVDWGVVDPWGIIEAKYSDGCLYLHELNYASENEIRAKLTTTELAQINAADEGIVKWKFGKLGIPKNNVIVCDNNRSLKILALREAGWDYAVAATKLPGSIIDGIDMLNNLRVYYTASSLNIKYEQENYSRRVDTHGIILEEPEDIDNHIAGDPPRYIALFLQAEGIIRK